jgi:hypothetical protein
LNPEPLPGEKGESSHNNIYANMYAVTKSYFFTGAISRVPTPFSLACFDTTLRAGRWANKQSTISSRYFKLPILLQQNNDPNRIARREPD